MNTIITMTINRITYEHYELKSPGWTRTDKPEPFAITRDNKWLHMHYQYIELLIEIFYVVYIHCMNSGHCNLMFICFLWINFVVIQITSEFYVSL